MWDGGECFRGQLLVSVGPLIRKPINNKKRVLCANTFRRQYYCSAVLGR